MESKKKDEGPNLMYNQLRKFISVVVSTYLQAAAFAVIFKITDANKPNFRMNSETSVFSNT